MVDTAGAGCIKYILFGFNLIFLICSIFLIGVGIFGMTQDEAALGGGKYLTAPIILIVLGGCVFVLSFLGCWGAIKENVCMIVTFTVLLTIVFIFQLVGIIAAYSYRNDVDKLLRQQLNESLWKTDESAVKAWNKMQKHMFCCGIDGHEDYVKHEKDIPASCCPEGEEECTEDNAFDRGCYGLMLKKVQENVSLMGGVAAGIGIIELGGIVFSICLLKSIEDEMYKEAESSEPPPSEEKGE